MVKRKFQDVECNSGVSDDLKENFQKENENSENKQTRSLKQPTIQSMFKKISEDNGKILQQNDTESAEPEKIKKKKTATTRCVDCRQCVDSPDIKLFPGAPENAEAEDIVLIHPSLSVYDENVAYDVDISEMPQHKITNFSIYDRYTHLCRFDNGLIEKNSKLYISGFVKPVYDENPTDEGGVPATNIGPIIEWWFTGFDSGTVCVLGVSTDLAEYILMKPSDVYSPFMEELITKMYLTKAVIELIAENSEATYEDLLNKLQNTVPPQGCDPFTENLLLHYAQFVVDQVRNFDSNGDDSDPVLMFSPCIRALINLSGITIGLKTALRKKGNFVPYKIKKPSHSLATTTPLVRSIFENFFTGQMEKTFSSTAPRRKRCGVCDACQRPDCGQCSSCKDMKKFGGNGTGKQACLTRRCPNMAVQEIDADDILEDNLEDESDSKSLNDVDCPKRKIVSKKIDQSSKAEWIGSPVDVESSKSYYEKASVNEFVVQPGDFVFVAADEPTTPMYIAKIMYMFEKKNGKKYYHALWFSRGSDTVLGETTDPFEVFGTFDCSDEEMSCIHSKCEVLYKEPQSDWSSIGGTEDSLKDDIIKSDDGGSFYIQKWYDGDTCRFEDPPSNFINDAEARHSCFSCVKQDENESESVQLGDKLDDDDDSKNVYYQSAKWLHESFHPSDCVYLDPDVYAFSVKKTKYDEKKASKVNSNLDEEKYPEAYRKSDYVKGSNVNLAQPFKIGYISKIFVEKKNPSSQPKILVKLFYRPEDTHRSTAINRTFDLNLLYWSDEETIVNFTSVKGKCFVVHSDNISESIEQFTHGGPHRFYFSECYISSSKTFEEPPLKARYLGYSGKGKGKGKGKKSNPVASKQNVKCTKDVIYPSITNKLRTLDLFAGCGGLTAGFHQVGLCETLWAVEKEQSAAQSFRLNFPSCSVFIEDCNLLLRSAMDGQETYKGQNLPQKGEVDMICGGPPCQGYSGMNRFNSREYSAFKNSLIVSYLSYCDYYRPRFVLLENVRNFVSFKRNMVLKLALRCLIRMGYQCTFGVLQAGSYGIPQTRRRAIILAAAPGEKLPLYPEPTHVFTHSQLSVAVDDKKYMSNIKWTSSAPYRSITVWDSMSDLPEIKNGAKVEEITYSSEPLCHFQKELRIDSNSFVRDHVCKEMSPLVEARMRHIPALPGADWRDLPNIVVRLSDGMFTKKLIYSHRDIKNGKASNGTFRGVCSCASKTPCDPSDRQCDTLIPWCLPHTGNRHNHWAGLYGRLEYDGYFSTTVTNPEPMGKQGRVLHPEQHRVVSVRECARSQGFPDWYKFYGNILERHRQIGNAVPPPLAAALGRQIKDSVSFKESEKKCN